MNESESQPEAKAGTRTQPEAKAKAPSDLTPPIARRAYEIHVERGRQSAAVPGIALLSGGQSGELASARLNAMKVRFKSRLPWALAFSFAIQQPALEIWRGKEANVSAAQEAPYHRAKCNRAVRRGEYSAAMERTRK